MEFSVSAWTPTQSQDTDILENVQKAAVNMINGLKRATYHNKLKELEAIKKSKSSKALGPDELSPVMLKHLGPKGIAYLTKIFNAVVNTANIPHIWKIGKIIPLLTPKKPADEGSS